MAHTLLTASLAQLGEFAEGERHGREALRIAEETGHHYSLVNALWSLGHLARLRGAADEAVRLLERGLQIERHGQLGTLERLRRDLSRGNRRGVERHLNAFVQRATTLRGTPLEPHVDALVGQAGMLWDGF